jgi:amino acid adenylation domain-containing protein
LTGPAHPFIVDQKQLEPCDPDRHPTASSQGVVLAASRQSIPDGIAAVAERAPTRVAVYDHQRSLTYAALDRAANQVANAVLAKRGRGQEVVALLTGVDLSAVIAALGILKACKIYVALEASLPHKRLLQILADTEASLILSDDLHLAQAQELAGSERQVVQLEALAVGDPSAPNVAVPLDAPALLIYTSGSTGQPKGVVQSHGSAYLQASRFVSDFHLGAADRLAFGESLAWASSFWDVFGPLCLGAATAPFDLRQHGMHRLVEWLLDTGPTIVAGRMFVRQIAYNNPQQQFPSVRLIWMGGDLITREDVRACVRVFPNAGIVTGLALSEAGRVTQLLVDSPQMSDWDVLPLGRPASGLQIRLLADDGREVEPGQVGEIVAAGDGLAPGYWRRPELTASKFRTVEALGPEPACFTGDLGRQAPDGLLHYMGRKDSMVKIRGYQVFTNEIERILHKVEGVKEACVVAHTLPEGVERLVAYVVTDLEVFPGVAALHAQFREIPRYMAPQSYLFLKALPRTPTGKVDRERLPLPERSRLGVTADYVTACDPIERALTGIWGRVLGIADIGVHDNFLELGGDSLDSMRIISWVVALTGTEVSMREFFGALTIAEMAAMIRDAL